MTTLVAIASDHAGFDLKTALLPSFAALDLEPLDLGTFSRESVDYPDIAKLVVEAMLSGRAARGVLICGTGIGVSIAANRHKGIRAALCHDGLTARLARQHNDANVLALGGRVIGVETAKDCLAEFMAARFEGGRHLRRVEKMG